MASGYTGRAVPLDAEALGRGSRGDLHRATVVDADDKNLGSSGRHGYSGYMRIEKDGLSVKDVFLPVTSVSFLR